MRQTKPTPGLSPFERTAFYNPADNPDLQVGKPALVNYHYVGLAIGLTLILIGVFG